MVRRRTENELQRRRASAVWMAGLLASSACVEPSYRADDAGAGDARAIASPGDGAAEEGGIDAVRATWVGRYATRSFLFSLDGPLKTSARLLTLAEIKPDASGGLQLEEELCYFEGTWNFLVTGQLVVDFPGTRVRSDVRFDEEQFSTPPTEVLFGYGAAPAGCASGALSSAASDAQPWLSGGSCDCPRDPQLPPSSTRDCRLSDPDGDGKPGATFKAMLESATAQYRVAQREEISLSHGYRLGDRLYANRAFNTQTSVLECTTGGSVMKGSDCPSGSALACPASHNLVELVPVAANLGCSQIVAREQGLFNVQRPEFPASCPSEISAP